MPSLSIRNCRTRWRSAAPQPQRISIFCRFLRRSCRDWQTPAITTANGAFLRAGLLGDDRNPGLMLALGSRIASFIASKGLTISFPWQAGSQIDGRQYEVTIARRDASYPGCLVTLVDRTAEHRTGQACAARDVHRSADRAAQPRGLCRPDRGTDRSRRRQAGQSRGADRRSRPFQPGQCLPGRHDRGRTADHRRAPHQIGAART